MTLGEPGTLPIETTETAPEPPSVPKARTPRRVAAPKSTQLAPIQEDESVGMFERLAKDASVPVDKLEKLIALQERILDREAEMSFNRAFARMQAKLPVVLERGRGDKNMAYAKHEDIVQQTRPVLEEFGFSLRHETSWPDDKTILITGVLTHEDGHSVRSQFKAEADNSGSKNKIQSYGSTMSYGRRYTTLDLLNIVSREDDDDGHKAGKKKTEREEPEGYDNWLVDLEIVAMQGTAALNEAWQKSSNEMRRYLVDTDKPRMEELKRKAAKATAAKQPKE